MASSCTPIYVRNDLTYVWIGGLSKNKDDCKGAAKVLTGSDTNSQYFYSNKCCWIKEEKMIDTHIGNMPKPSDFWVDLPTYDAFMFGLGAVAAYLFTRYLWGYS